MEGEDVYKRQVLAYSFWCPLILVPLAAAFLGVKSNGRAFRYALAAGLISTLTWNYVLHRPWGIDGAVIGTLLNLIVFALCTRAFGHERIQRVQVWRDERPRLHPPVRTVAYFDRRK